MKNINGVYSKDHHYFISESDYYLVINLLLDLCQRCLWKVMRR